MKQLPYVLKIFCAMLCVVALLTGCEQEKESAKIKLYTLDCGTLDVNEMDAFSDDGKLKGHKAKLVNPCFLIRHPKGDLLWDLGFQQDLAEKENGAIFFQHFHKKMRLKLSDQLKQLGLKPDDIEFISLSHQHDDHIGNANLFPQSNWIAQEVEYKQMFSEENRSQQEVFSLYDKLETAKTTLFKNNFDVFGDNKVIVKWMPGHTDGSTILLIRLDSAGTILLTGDLYTHADARVSNSVPIFNTDKQATLESRKQFEILATAEKAKVVIQHEKSHFDTLPKFPNFLY